MAEVLRAQGSKRALIVHSADGMDELSISAPTFACELSEGHIREFVIEPLSLGITAASTIAFKVANAGESLQLLRSVLSGIESPAAEIVTLNAAAGLYVAGLQPNLGQAVLAAREILRSGAGLSVLERYVQLTKELASER